MIWIIKIFAVIGFLSLVGTAGVIFAAWACHSETDEDAKRRHARLMRGDS